jgi:hypothetical protein
MNTGNSPHRPAYGLPVSLLSAAVLLFALAKKIADLVIGTGGGLSGASSRANVAGLLYWVAIAFLLTGLWVGIRRWRHGRM